jgi:2-alkyl-3-oxoalkanoate reductase
VKALVTGASGFIGSHIVEQLQQQGHEVRALVRPTSDTSFLEQLEVDLAVGDVTDPDSLNDATRGVDTVFHTAAVVGNYGQWKHFREVGVRGTLNTLNAAAANEVSRFIHLGSIAVYGTRTNGQPFTEDTPFDDRPERWNHYVREKVLSEKLLWKAHREGKVQATSLRPSVVLGPRDRNAIGRTISIMQSPFGAIIGSGTTRFPAVVIEDVVDGVLKAATSDVAIGRAYNLSGRDPITEAEYLRLMAEAAGIRPLTRKMPVPAVMAMATVLETLYGLARRKQEPFITRIAVAIAGGDYQIDCSRAAADLGWEGARDYGDALRRSVEWYRSTEK